MGRLLLLAESIVVTAHGHNWGSNHDPSTAACSPSQDNGGKYLMYAIAQDGSLPNNMRFSECSRRAISQVLRTHEDSCFVAPSSSRCGDFNVDEAHDEDCDPGPTGVLHNGDTCCTNNCFFKPNSICSDVNHDCCQDCQPKANGTVCEIFEAGNANCLANRVCNGTGVMCPNVNVYVAEDTTCGFMGRCVPTGVQDVMRCQEFCEQVNLTSCHCSGIDECRLCCADVRNNGTCIPYVPESFLPEGSFCEGGRCDAMGVCVLSTPDLATFLFDLFNAFSTSAFRKLLAENIVGSVIILSLILWIPVSVFVHVFDVWLERKKNKAKKQKAKLPLDDETETLLEKVPLDSKDEMPASFFLPTKPDPEHHNIMVHTSNK